jgi:hypothetical protein
MERETVGMRYRRFDQAVPRHKCRADLDNFNKLSLDAPIGIVHRDELNEPIWGLPPTSPLGRGEGHHCGGSHAE